MAIAHAIQTNTHLNRGSGASTSSISPLESYVWLASSSAYFIPFSASLHTSLQTCTVLFVQLRRELRDLPNQSQLMYGVHCFPTGASSSSPSSRFGRETGFTENFLQQCCCCPLQLLWGWETKMCFPSTLVLPQALLEQDPTNSQAGQKPESCHRAMT